MHRHEWKYELFIPYKIQENNRYNLVLTDTGQNGQYRNLWENCEGKRGRENPASRKDQGVGNGTINLQIIVINLSILTQQPFVRGYNAIEELLWVRKRKIRTEASEGKGKVLETAGLDEGGVWGQNTGDRDRKGGGVLVVE